jgi:hypothetical protein
MIRWWLSGSLLLPLLAGVAGPALCADTAAEVLEAVNAERARLDLAAMVRSEALDRVAAERAAEISAGNHLDFEGMGGVELLLFARELGYDGLMVQELAAVDDSVACELLDAWNLRLGTSDVYRRPEARDLGIGQGFVGDSPLTIIVVGVPISNDPIRRRWPGVAPREYLIDDLLHRMAQLRFGLGLPLFERSEDLDPDAQQIADELLGDPNLHLSGEMPHGQAMVVYFKGEGLLAWDPGASVVEWLHDHREVIATKRKARIGAGLASRGRGDRLEAVWVLVIEPTRR